MHSRPLYVLLYDEFDTDTTTVLGVADDLVLAQEVIRKAAEAAKLEVLPATPPDEDTWKYVACNSVGVPDGIYSIHKVPGWAKEDTSNA